MSKVYSVVWSSLAENDFSNILDYLHCKWNNRVTNNFIDKIEYTIKQIQINPKLFPLIHNNGIRRCVVTQHNTIFYRINNNTIEILRLYDTRQDPDKLKFNN